MEIYSYKCKENENDLCICLEDDYEGNPLDEIWVGCPLPEEGRTVIGINDLQSALKMCGYTIVKI